MDYLARRNYLQRHQREPFRDDQVQNNAGGFVWEVDQWQYLRRFLVLGSEGGTYYVNEDKLTRENVRNVEKCIIDDPVKAVDIIFEMRDRVPKRNPIFYSLALAFTVTTSIAFDKDAPHSEEKKRACMDAINKIHGEFTDIVRTGGDILQFVTYIEDMRGWGRSLMRLVSSWYQKKLDDGSLTYQVLKYQNRNGMTHKRVLRRCHFNKNAPEQDSNQGVLRWIIGTDTGKRIVRRDESGLSIFYTDSTPYPAMIQGYEELKRAESLSRVIGLIEEHRFTHEMIPNKWKNHARLWESLLEKMPVTATIRNLAKMTNIGAIAPLSGCSQMVLDRLEKDVLLKAKVHPIQMLMAYLTYKAGHGSRGSLTWTPLQPLVDALHEGFYHSFGNVQATDKNTLIAIDVSSSMAGGQLAGCVGLTPAVASAALAMVTARVEPNYHIMGFANNFRELNITASDTLDTAMQKVQDYNFGATDCALPMKYANFKDMDVESFMVLTDHETWFGDIHPAQAISEYRAKHKKRAAGFRSDSNMHKLALRCADARFAFVAMVSTRNTIADPKDPGMLDVVGFDSGTPQILSAFFNGEF